LLLHPAVIIPIKRDSTENDVVARGRNKPALGYAQWFPVCWTMSASCCAQEMLPALFNKINAQHAACKLRISHPISSPCGTVTTWFGMISLHHTSMHIGCRVLL
jgi:hypothetical protein